VLQALCIYLQAFFNQEKYVEPKDRWALCGSIQDDMRGKLLDTKYGLDVVVPEELDSTRQQVLELQALASDQKRLNKILERAANVQWVMHEAERMWVNLPQGDMSSLRSEGMSLEQAQKYLEIRLEEWGEFIQECENA
jgi:hypothetical protein